MNKPVTITTQIDANTHALLRRVVDWLGRSESDFIAEAVQRVTESEADYLAFIQEGIDAADRGDLIPHAVVMAELDEMIAKQRARCGR